MKIKVDKQKDSCINKDIEIELGDYTVLAGENNSGKTSIVRAIKDHKNIKSEYGNRIIFIPSDSIHPEDQELKKSASGDAFYKVLDGILTPIFKSSMFKTLVSDFNNSSEKQNFVSRVNKILNNELGVHKKKFEIRINTDDLTHKIIIKEAIQAYVKDLYETDIDDVNLRDIGMGTQRMIITALIQSYGKINNQEKTFVIIEEPEIYLHPRWKKNLHDALLKLSKDKNIKVLITTHDPYFIERNVGQTIYKVFRNSKEKDTTDIELVKDNIGKLGYKSDGEINYSIFGIPSKSYFLELYEHVKDSSGKGPKDFESFLFSKITDQSQFDRDDAEPWKLTYISRLRHNLAHPKDINKRKVKADLSERVEDAIIDLTKLA